MWLHPYLLHFKAALIALSVSVSTALRESSKIRIELFKIMVLSLASSFASAPP